MEEEVDENVITIELRIDNEKTHRFTVGLSEDWFY